MDTMRLRLKTNKNRIHNIWLQCPTSEDIHNTFITGKDIIQTAPDVKYLRGTLDGELNFNKDNHEDKESNVKFHMYKVNTEIPS